MLVTANRSCILKCILRNNSCLLIANINCLRNHSSRGRPKQLAASPFTAQLSSLTICHSTNLLLPFTLANAPASNRKDLLSELELMTKLKPHAHVIKLIGCVTESGKNSLQIWQGVLMLKRNMLTIFKNGPTEVQDFL